jgi:ABC-type multidrug transport system fused ATPase/permease subunit
MYLATFAPGLLLAGLAGVFLAKEVLGVGTDSWLAYWSSAEPFPVALFLGGFLTLGLLACASNYLRSLLVQLRGLAAGTAFHTDLLTSVLRAPMAFFEGTPVGRVLNRFSRDMEAVDQQIPRSLLDALGCVFTIVSTLSVVVVVTPWALLAVGPIALMYYRVQRYYRPASREGQRLDSVTRSPLFAQFSESLAGVQIIRAYAAERRFEAELLANLETNSRSFYTIVSANRWLGTRIETLGAAIVATAAFAAVLAQGYVKPGFAGLSVTYALAITGAMNWAVRMFSQLESNLNSVERIDHYAKLEAERWEGAAPPPAWPSAGRIEFEGLSLRYRPDLPAVVRDFHCAILPGEKVGVVGRTGAGKSSLLLGLFRVVEPCGGRILIDGVDISTLGLESLRSALAIIPQEPVLFRGSVRKNLDPFGAYPDERLWDALRRARLAGHVEALARGLDADVHEGGSNFSVGQRQLLCLARAILKRSRVLLLDEATASVDVATDALIQKTIRAEFADATVITIAHRLNTVMDSDRIMVLEAGRVVEFDAPPALLRNKEGAFSALVIEAEA